MRIIILGLILISSLPVFALNTDELDTISEYNLVKTDVRKKMDGWELNPSKLDVDSYKFKTQTRNSTDWENINAYNWLDFNAWVKDREIKDNNLEWRRRLREKTNAEVMGRVLKCMGVCGNYRGSNRSGSEYLSNLKEGDEFITETDSYAWILLADGSMLKVSPNSSVTLQELNFSKKEVLVMLRLNRGYIHFQTRKQGVFKSIDRPETDLSFYPLMVKQANREYYSIQEWRKLDEASKLAYSVKVNPGSTSQYERLNELMLENQKLFVGRDTRFYIYTANTSLEGLNTGASLFSEPNGKSFFRFMNSPRNFEKNDDRVEVNTVMLRGYTNSEVTEVDEKVWYEVNPEGTLLSPMTDSTANLDGSVALLNRIPTIHTARELWIQKYSKGFLMFNMDAKELAVEHGYRLWDFFEKNEMGRRMEFVREYVRRVETTNLKSIKRLFKRNKPKGFVKSYYAKAMRVHYQQIRNKYGRDALRVKEMDDNNYYLWILRNEKR